MTKRHSEIKFLRLAECPDVAATVANWYFTEWGHYNPASTENDVLENLQIYLHNGDLPQALVAMDSSRPVAVAELKFHELSMFPQHEHWLGGVFVREDYRGMSLGSELVQRSVALAAFHQVTEIFLQTTSLDGGLYRRLGWEPVESFEHKGDLKLLMVKRLTA